MLTTLENEDGLLCNCDEILDQDSNATNSDGATAQTDEHSQLVVVDDEEDEDDDDEDDDDEEDGSSDDEEFENDDEDNDGEDELDDEDEIVLPKSTVIVKAKNASTTNGAAAGRSGISSTTGPSKMSPATSSMLTTQHRKHHHRRLASRPAITVGVKAGSSRGLAGTKCSALRSRKPASSSGNCHSPICAGTTTSEEDDDDDELVEVDESLDREESDDDDDDEDGLEPSDFLLPPDGDPSSIQGIPPDAQARLEAFFEAAGFTDGRLMSDPESLRKLTMTVSSALGEASAAINRMRDSQRYDEPSRRKSLEDGRSDSMEEGDSLLALACSSGYFELARVLLAMGANVDDRGSKGDLTPLMDAASQGHVEIVRLLINHGADVNAQSACGNSPLMYACAAGHEDIVKELLKAGGNVEDNNENGHTPLMEAASAGHVGAAKILLEHGAGINTHSNEFKESALTVACYKGHLDMVKFLLEAGADQQHKTDEMHTALMEASMDGHVEVAKLLLDSGAQVNMPADSFESPLTLAACGGHVELAELLIERGAKVEEVNDEGYTPLMEAAREGHLSVVQCLLQNGSAINSQTEETHETALTLAACGGFLDVVDVLLKSGADVEIGASTPLMEAAQEGHLTVVKYLLDRGADIRRQTQTGDTALSYACENGHLPVAELLVDFGADHEHLSEGGRTPLMKACRGGHLEVIKFLLQKGANVNRQSTNNDHTPLSLACAGGHVTCVEALLSAGANPFHKLKDNTTMLIEAARGGHAGVMKVLLDFPPAHLKGHVMSSAGGKAQCGPPGKSSATAGQRLDASTKTGSNQAQAKNSVSVLRKSRSTSTLDPSTTTQVNKECLHNKADTQLEGQGDKNAPKAPKSLAAETQKNSATPQSCSSSGVQKQASVQSGSASISGAERKETSTNNAGYCSECISKETAEIHQGQETQSTGQTSVKRSVRTESSSTAGQAVTASSVTSTQATLSQSGPPLAPSQVTAATAISERPKAKPSKPSARKQAQLQQHQGTVSPGVSPGSEKGQLSPSGSTTSSSSGLSPTALSSASTPTLGAPKAVQQIPPNYVPSTVTSSASAAVVQMQVQQVRSNISTTPSYGNPPIKLDSKQLTHLFAQHQHQIINKTKAGGVFPGNGNEQTGGNLGIGSATTTTTTTTVVVTHGNGETETIIEGDNLPPGANEMIMNAAAAAFPLDCFPMQSGLQMNPPSGVHRQSYQLSSPGTVSNIGVAPMTTTTMQTTTIINSATGISGFQPPMVLPHPPPLPPAIVSAAAAAGIVPPSGAPPPPPPGVIKSSSSKAKDLQKSNMNQVVKSLSGSSAPQPVQQQTPSVPPVATVAGIQTTKKQLAKRSRPFGNSSGNSQSRQGPNQGHAAHAKQNQAVASTQTTMTGQISADKILKHLDLDCATESGGETSLTVAAASGHYEVVDFLLSRKAHIEHRDKKGCTSLILAADGGHDKIVELLITHGADIEAQSDRTKDTALSLACTKGRYEVVEQLLKKGANKEHRNVSDYTPLSLAASGGYVNIIKLLLQNGAEINSRTGSKLGISPLMLAAMNGNTAAVKLLLDMGSDINAQIETNKNTALTLACFQGRQEVVSLLLDRKANLEHRAKTGLTPLMEAANGGYTEVGKILLDRGADVNAAPVPATKDTALTIAADKGHFRFVELLLQRGAMVEVRNKKGCTPLWLACHGGHSDVAQILFKHCADLDAQDNRKVSCLMAAFRKGHVKVIRWIVKNVQQFPSDGEMIRFYASIQNEPDLIKKCQQCAEFVKQAKDKQAQEASKNANMLLQELDLEKSREESKKQAAARRREKKKKKKQEKKQVTVGGKDDDDDENDDDEQKDVDDEILNTVDSGIDANSLGSSSSTGNDNRKGVTKDNKENLLQQSSQVVSEQIPEPNIQAKQSANAKSKKKKNKKEKEKSTPTPPIEDSSPVVLDQNHRKPFMDSRKPTTGKDILKESENRNVSEEKEIKINEKLNSTSRDKRAKKDNFEFYEDDQNQAKNSLKDNNANVKLGNKKTSKHMTESTGNSISNVSPHHHPEPLMGIRLNPSSMRKSGESTVESHSSQSQYYTSPPSNTKTTSGTSASGFQVVGGKGGRKDDGWKEVTRSCPSSRSKKVIVPSNVISRVIGRGGCNINAIREATGAHIEVEKQQKGQVQPERTIQIKGTVETTKQAHTLITALMNEPDLDVKKLLPVIAQTANTCSWTMPIYTATTTVGGSSQRLTSSTLASVPASLTMDNSNSTSSLDFDVKKIAPITSQAVNSTNWGTPTFTATVSTSSQRLATSTPSITVPASLPIDTKGSVDLDMKKPVPVTPQTVNSSGWGSPVYATNVSVSNQRLPSGTPLSSNSIAVAPPTSVPIEINSVTASTGFSANKKVAPPKGSTSPVIVSSSPPAPKVHHVERAPQGQGGLTLEYSPFNYQFSKTSSPGWYQDDFTQSTSSFSNPLSGSPENVQQSGCNLGPVGTASNHALNLHGNSAAARAMNFASVAASGISSSMSTTSALMSQPGILNGSGHFNPLGLSPLTPGGGKSPNDEFLDSDVPKADASKAPGYRGNTVGSPVHRAQNMVSGIQSNFTNENMSLPQFQGPHTGIMTSQGNQNVIGFPRQLNQNLNNQPFPSNGGAALGGGIQQHNPSEFAPRNLSSPLTTNAYPNSSGIQVSSTQTRNVSSLVISSRLNPRAPSFTLTHSKMSPAVQPPSQQFNSIHSQQHNSYKMGPLAFGARPNSGLSNQGRQTNIGGMNISNQGWNAYTGETIDFQCLPSAGSHQPIDQTMLPSSNIDSHFDSTGTIKQEDRRGQRPIGPIGAERSMKSSGAVPPAPTNSVPLNLPLDFVDSGHLGIQPQQNPSVHLQQQNSSSWGGMFGTSNPQHFLGSNQHHQPLPPLAGVTPAHASHIPRGNGDIRPFTGNRFLEQVEPNRFLDYHQMNQMYEGQRLLNGAGVPAMMIPNNVQQNMFPFGIEQPEQIAKIDHLNTSWGDSHIMDDKQNMNWGKWGN